MKNIYILFIALSALFLTIIGKTKCAVFENEMYKF